MVAELFKLNLAFRGLSDEDTEEPGVDTGGDIDEEDGDKAPAGDNDEDDVDAAVM